MLYMVCPTCGELLGNKELVYINRMKEICTSMGIDDDIISQGKIIKTKEYIEGRQKILNELVKNPCCKMRMMNYLDVVTLVKG